MHKNLKIVVRCFLLPFSDLLSKNNNNKQTNKPKPKRTTTYKTKAKCNKSKQSNSHNNYCLDLMDMLTIVQMFMLSLTLDWICSHSWVLHLYAKFSDFVRR